MSNRILLLALGCSVCFFALLNECPDVDVDTKRFVVVSSLSEAEKFYPDIRFTKLMNRENEPEISIEVKKRICEDITTNHIFRRSGRMPYEKYVDWFSRLVDRLDYATKTITVLPYRGHDELTERVFVCVVREGWSNKEYYISDEYNLNAAWGQPQAKYYLAGRFVFHQLLNFVTRLYALAELPAEAFFSPDYALEDIYRYRRGIFNTAWTAEQDALCKLKANDKERICAAALGSKHLDQRIKYSSGDKFEGNNPCKLRTVTLQTGPEESEVANRDSQFKEWTLSCRSAEEKVSFDYLLSHAYVFNQIFVYFLPEGNENVFLDALATNVRLIFDPSRAWFSAKKPKFLAGRNVSGTQEMAGSGTLETVAEPATPRYRRYNSSLSTLKYSPSLRDQRMSSPNRASPSPPSTRHRSGGGSGSKKTSDPSTWTPHPHRSTNVLDIASYHPTPILGHRSSSRRMNINQSRSFPSYYLKSDDYTDDERNNGR